MKTIVLLLATILLVSACGTTLERKTPPEVVKPKTQTLEESKIGYVQKITLALSDSRITHVLVDTPERGALLAMLQSQSVDLSQYEGQRVEVQGISQTTPDGKSVMDVTTIISITGKQQEQIITAMREKAAKWTTPMVFSDQDQFTVLMTSESAGTATIQVVTTAQKIYTVKMVRKPDPKFGQWEIYELTEGGAPLTDSGEQIAESSDGTTPVNPTEVKPAITIDVKSTDADPKEAAIVQNLLQTAGAQLKTELTLSGEPTFTEIDLAKPGYAYLIYKIEDKKGRVLVKYSEEGKTFSVEAVFEPGTGSDWARVSGTNSQATSGLSIYRKEGTTWVRKIQTDESYTLYEHPSGQYFFQYPRLWYHWLHGARISFSNVPVEEDNILVDFEVVTGSLSAAALLYPNATTDQPMTVGELSGSERHYADGTVKYFLQGKSKTYIFTASSADYVPAAKKMMSSLREE